MSAKNSHSRARARITPPSAAKEEKPAFPHDTIQVATGPNVTGHADQIASVHVDEDGTAPADAASESAHEEA